MTSTVDLTSYNSYIMDSKRHDGKDINDMTFKENALKMSLVTQHNFYNFDFETKDVVFMRRSPQ